MNEEAHNITIKKEELEEILHRGLKKSLVIESYSYKSAHEKGKNYGSTLLSLTVKVTFTETGVSETLNIMAKLAPPTEFLQSVFDFPNTFCKEMNFYKLVHPEYTNFQIRYGNNENGVVSLIPPFYGARTSLTGDDDEIADTTAMLLMGDLRPMGYKVENQRKGLDLHHCELVISKLAEFHALPIAMREKDQDRYTRTVKKAAIFHDNEAFNASAREKVRNEFLEHLETNNPNLSPYFSKIRNRFTENDLNYVPLHKEPFSTLVHMDLWTNNILFSYTDQNNPNCPTQVKFIDFQGTVLCSPVKDLIFFLYSSAEDYVLEKYYDDLISNYYNTLVNKLEHLQCDIQKFSKESFYEELSIYAPSQFSHIIFMLTVIYADRNNVTALEDITSFDNMLISWNDLTKQKLERTIISFDKNGWI